MLGPHIAFLGLPLLLLKFLRMFLFLFLARLVLSSENILLVLLLIILKAFHVGRQLDLDYVFTKP